MQQHYRRCNDKQKRKYLTAYERQRIKTISAAAINQFPQPRGHCQPNKENYL
jgi:hypothetical protein